MIGALGRLRQATILVAGDFLLDVYTKGRAERLSPEAPVPILRVCHRESLPGGAGNVALNLCALGAHVALLGRVGNDEQGKLLREIFQRYGIDTCGLVTDSAWKTPVKNRLMADGQHLIRVDEESVSALSPTIKSKVLDVFMRLQSDVEVIALSDYAKGFFSSSLLEAMIAQAKRLRIPCVVDPKGSDFAKYAGATLVTPNRVEAYAAAQLPLSAPLCEVGTQLLQKTGAEQLLITQSERGMTLFRKKTPPLAIEAKAREVNDVTGAGDTVLAMVAMTLAAKVNLVEGLHLANVAAGLAVEQAGCARIFLSAIAERLFEEHIGDKIFREEHLFVFERIVADKELIIVGLDAKQKLSSGLLRQVQQIERKKDFERVVVYLMNGEPTRACTELLASLRAVDFIVVQSKKLATLFSRTVPKRAFLVRKETLIPAADPSLFVRSL